MSFVRMASVAALLTLAIVEPTIAVTLDLTSGTAGTFTGVPQSFNETRGVDVTVLSATNRTITSMSLSGLYVSTTTATVGARVYASPSGALLTSASTMVSSGSNLSVSIPISAVLQSGLSYRLSFFVDAGGSGGSGIMFDPAPPSVGGFPYTESNGILRINQAYSGIADAYPTGMNIFVPLIAVEVPCAAQFDVTSGASGSTLHGQSFNGETRGVDVTVGPPCGNLVVTSMSVHGINTDGANVGARIYNNTTGALIAGADRVVGAGIDLTVIIPLSATLVVGTHYRVSFFVESGSGRMFDPAPPSVGGFPYVDATGVLTINQAYSIAADAFPTNMNIFVPSIRINTGTFAVDAPDRTTNMAEATRASLSAPRPNPFPSSAVVEFSLARAGLVDLSVHDVTGRVVSEQDLGVVGPGSHLWRWDAIDFEGQAVAGGVYFIRLRVGGTVAGTQKAVLLR